MIDTAYRVRPLGTADPERVGDYLLVGRLGGGGMGMVYLAESDDGSYVAIKLIHPFLATDPEFARRFRGEVDRARRVPPFCTAEFLHADLDHDPPYLVVEYIDGPSLDEVVTERGPLRGGALHSLAVGVATALTGIHGAGIIHRDLKPDNVLLAPGSPKVIDFGIARPFEATSQHTRTDVMVGTVAYMAPERFSGESETPVTAAADVFAWGCVIVFAATGKTPFHGDSPSATAARILTQPPRLDGLPEPLRKAVGAALAKDPADRPTAPELLTTLLRAESVTPAPAGDRPPPTEPPPAFRSTRRGRAVLSALVALPVLAGVGIAGLVADDTSRTGRAGSPSPSPSSTMPAPTPTPVPTPTRSLRAGDDGGGLLPTASSTTTPAARAAVNTSRRNLALGREVTASSEQSPALAGANAVDGDPATRWGSQYRNPQWLIVDLGSPWRISEVVLRWQPSARAVFFRLDTSTDGRQWKTVYNGIFGSGEVDRIPLDGVTGRFVKMHGTQQSGERGYSLHEIEVR
ncbi:serine/threonine protein kinase [Micromonospora wenchangensis]|uniref:serine/threonine protein kinase n=1 Tax=Micromonospora wenchangensis TaxID=1185415 RepID=UPI0038081D80